MSDRTPFIYELCNAAYCNYPMDKTIIDIFEN